MSARAHSAAATKNELRGLTRAQLTAMAAAGNEALECERVLSRTGDNIVGEVLRHQDQFREWDHFPKGDVHDRDHNALYFYHAHAKSERALGEHGHFHLFRRDGTADKPVLCHLIGASMDRHGHLIRLFTTNGWVTGEVWQAAPQVIDHLGNFRIDHARPSWPTNRWITAIVTLFQPQIAALVEARDRAIDQARNDQPDDQRCAYDVFEDRSLNVLSEQWITITDHMAAIKRALRR